MNTVISASILFRRVGLSENKNEGHPIQRFDVDVIAMLVLHYGDEQRDREHPVAVSEERQFYETAT